MKTILVFIFVAATTIVSPAVGLVNFANTPATLISVHGAPMPTRTVQEYVFAVFLAPGSTVEDSGLLASFTDPAFQLAAGYNTNHSSLLGVGRITTRTSVDVGTISGYSAGDFVDFVIRGWSSNLGYTWSEALANWNHGFPVVSNCAMGSSTIGNDLLLGGEFIPNMVLFGSAYSQVRGFDMVPEPASYVLIGLGLGIWRRIRRRGAFN